jgi:hypothetical protein
MSRNPSSTLVRYWQRAYEGPVLKKLVIDEILYFAPLAAKNLDISNDKLEKEKILDAIKFLELTAASRGFIDLEYPGVHKIFLPYENDRWFIDYAWLHSLLYNLFIGVSPNDQKFKGDLLEDVVNFKKSILPTKPCKSLGGKSKQVDASFEVGNRLIIVECKAINKSVAFDKGEALAIRFRNEKFARALNEVDEKAKWLMLNPLGTNYDIRQYQEIVPLVVSPFIEYVPSLDKFYWLNPDTPRILTPEELKSFLDDGKLSGDLYNIVKLTHDS